MKKPFLYVDPDIVELEDQGFVIRLLVQYNGTSKVKLVVHIGIIVPLLKVPNFILLCGEQA